MRLRLQQFTDWIKIGLAGNLKNYRLVDQSGRQINGAELDYLGQPAAYALNPQENILYVSAHDNETLFDAIQMKASPSVSLESRCRMHTLGQSLILLGQGIPFIQAGDEILRSKSFDRNSYKSGDWFNHLDYTLETNNFGIGLPLAAENDARWRFLTPMLANPALKPSKFDLQASLARFQDLLKIRKSSPLFRLHSSKEIQTRLTFLNNGPEQIPGLIVMNLVDLPEDRLDPNYALITVIFNANPKEVRFFLPDLQGAPVVLHPVQAHSADLIVRQASFDAQNAAFNIPGLTTAVFVISPGNGFIPPPIFIPNKPGR
jgi:pullulanase/glycogen debranching enzyme